MKFAFIDAQKAHYEVRMMCRVLAVSPAGYYAWRKRPRSKRAVDNEQLTERVRRAFVANRESYGSPRITRELRATGVKVGRHRVARLMRVARLRVSLRRRWVVRTTDSRHSQPIAPNLLQREFCVEQPNRVWAGDITYLPTRDGWLYLAVVLDLYSRKVVGWSMSANIDGQLTLDALKMALARRRPAAGLLHHSDRGVQYAAGDYRQLLADHGLRASMSGKRNCWDNAVVESFFGTLKAELLRGVAFTGRSEARAQVFEYIEVFYNRRRRHSFLDYLSPEEYERTVKVA
jgi:transposase InsO family protein